MKTKLQIKDIVQATGLDRETLRFYEQKGIFPKAERTTSGYRQYDSEILHRIQFIKMAQDVGFTLKEILELLNLGKKKISRSDLQNIAESKIQDIDLKILKLTRMKQTIEGLSQRALKISSKSSCPILSQFKNLEL